MNYLNLFFFGVYPYLAGAIFIIGSWLRYDYGQYSWRAGSSQFMSKKNTIWASNLFHIGIICIFLGHLFGMLTPHAFYASFLPMPTKQMIAMIAGGIFGIIMLIGGITLMLRRFNEKSVHMNSSFMDFLIITIIVIQGILGMVTIYFSAQKIDGSEMMNVIHWAQSIVTFRTNAADYLLDGHIVLKIHLVLGMTLFLLLPFSRLVHIWSIPISYLTRRTQLVRTRR